jgi:hypothetical protein
MKLTSLVPMNKPTTFPFLGFLNNFRRHLLLSIARHGQSLSSKGWMMVDAWTTVMSSDNECGHYCRQPDGHYYTIAVTNRQDLQKYFIECSELRV